jgi:hypothetical protein
MKPSSEYSDAIDSVSSDLKKAEAALTNCEFVGPNNEAANHSRHELIEGLVDLGRGE